ncbi:uncharacterized protein LOC135498450 [Lineus longissimus]|uniref:uncharacterized protein LOC135498450 n=1 Tax=Lineus longissimus TaxID=88925 RepID=UPI002B4CA327
MAAVTHDDAIEVLSIHENNNQAFYDLTPSDFTDRFRVIGGDGDDIIDHDKTMVIPKVREVQSLKQKKIARIVMAIAIIMLLTSIVLVAATLTMSDHIDDMVRKMHGDIRPIKTKPRPTTSGTTTTESTTLPTQHPQNATDGG